MATTDQHPSPPYASYISFQNYRDRLKGAPLPSRLDKSVMSHLNYGTRQALAAALRSLSLIDDSDAPTERLERLVSADGEGAKAILLETAKDTYPYFWDGTIDLRKTTPGEFQQLIRDATGVAGSTVEKASSFFFGLANEAGIELSPHLINRKPGGGGNGKRSKPRPKKQKAAQVRPEPGGDAANRQNQPANMAESLLAKFPELNPDWSEDLQKKWFSAFEKLMNSAQKAGQI